MTTRKTTPKKPQHLTQEQEEALLLLSLEQLKARLADTSTSSSELAKVSSELRQVLVALRRISDLAPADPNVDPIEAIKLRVTGGTR